MATAGPVVLPALSGFRAITLPTTCRISPGMPRARLRLLYRAIIPVRLAVG